MIWKNRYGIEQEYTLLQKDVKWPIGWPIGGYPGPQVMNLVSFRRYFFGLHRNKVTNHAFRLPCD